MQLLAQASSWQFIAQLSNATAFGFAARHELQLPPAAGGVVDEGKVGVEPVFAVFDGEDVLVDDFVLLLDFFAGVVSSSSSSSPFESAEELSPTSPTGGAEQATEARPAIMTREAIERRFAVFMVVGSLSRFRCLRRSVTNPFATGRPTPTTEPIRGYLS
jgi:hypothetical protein